MITVCSLCVMPLKTQHLRCEGGNVHATSRSELNAMYSTLLYCTQSASILGGLRNIVAENEKFIVFCARKYCVIPDTCFRVFLTGSLKNNSSTFVSSLKVLIVAIKGIQTVGVFTVWFK